MVSVLTGLVGLAFATTGVPRLSSQSKSASSSLFSVVIANAVAEGARAFNQSGSSAAAMSFSAGFAALLSSTCCRAIISASALPSDGSQPDCFIQVGISPAGWVGLFVET